MSTGNDYSDKAELEFIANTHFLFKTRIHRRGSNGIFLKWLTIFVVLHYKQLKSKEVYVCDDTVIHINYGCNYTFVQKFRH